MKRFVYLSVVMALLLAGWMPAAATDGDDRWSSMPGITGGIDAMVSDGTNLYVAGWLTFTDGSDTESYRIAKWNGTQWTNLGDLEGAGNNSVIIHTLAIGIDSLYAGGYFVTLGGVAAKSMAAWSCIEGTCTWSAMNTSAWNDPYSNGVPEVYALAWDGASLYAGGWFVEATTLRALARWNPTTQAWSDAGWGTDQDDEVDALAWDGTNLYAAGGLADDRVVRRLSGGSWTSLADRCGWITSLLPTDSNLYVAGNFTQIGTPGGSTVPANNLAVLNGGAWSALGDGVSPTDEWETYPAVRALAKSGSDLYVGGHFTAAGSGAASHIARWDGSAWSTLGSGLGGAESWNGVYDLALAGDGYLYVGGWFPSAGGTSTPGGLAKWSLTEPAGYDISGTVFDDQNANGAYDPGEPGLSGVQVQLDKGCDQSVDATVNSASDGSYSFADQAPGSSYCLGATAPVGYTLTREDAYIASLSADTTGRDFGFTSVPFFTWSPATPNEGGSATFTAVDGWNTYGWKVGQPGSDCSSWSWGLVDESTRVADLSFGASGQYQVCLRLSMSIPLLYVYTGQTVTVANVAPVVTSGPSASPEPSNVGDAVSVELAFSDYYDTVTCMIDYGDGTVAPGTIGSGEPVCSGSHAYTAAGTYTIRFRLSDEVATTEATVAHVVNAPVASADLSITKTDSKDPTRPGARLTYTLVVTNLGPDSASSVKVVDTLDSHTTYTSISKPKGWTCSTGSTVTCSATSLGKSATATIKITVTVAKSAPVGTSLINVAEVSSNTLDPVTTNNSVTQTTLVSK
jgi:uncharacterized repeat protein (TIGR01451 family)